MPLFLPNFQKHKGAEREIVAPLVTSFIGLTYEGISSYLNAK